MDNLRDNGQNSSSDSSGSNVLSNENSIKQKYASLTDDQVANMREQLEGLLNYKKSEKLKEAQNFLSGLTSGR